MFNTGNMGGGGFAPAGNGNGGYVRLATGYPLTLTNTLNIEPISLVVGGAAGGVGDRTPNLFSFSGWLAKLQSQTAKIQRGTFTAGSDYITLTATENGCYTVSYEDHGSISGAYAVSVSPNTAYRFTWKATGASGSASVFINGQTSNIKRASNTVGSISFTTPSNASFINIRFDVDNAGTSCTFSEMQMNTAAEYEPYGYKIPILLNGSSWATIYTKEQLLSGNDVLVYPGDNKAYMDDTEISELQNWDQDWKLARTSSVTVTAGTTVTPSCLKLQYFSSLPATGTRAMPSEANEEAALNEVSEPYSLDEAETDDPDTYESVER